MYFAFIFKQEMTHTLEISFLSLVFTEFFVVFSLLSRELVILFSLLFAVLLRFHFCNYSSLCYLTPTTELTVSRVCAESSRIEISLAWDGTSLLSQMGILLHRVEFGVLIFDVRPCGFSPTFREEVFSRTSSSSKAFLFYHELGSVDVFALSLFHLLSPSFTSIRNLQFCIQTIQIISQ